MRTSLLANIVHVICVFGLGITCTASVTYITWDSVENIALASPRLLFILLVLSQLCLVAPVDEWRNGERVWRWPYHYGVRRKYGLALMGLVAGCVLHLLNVIAIIRDPTIYMGTRRWCGLALNTVLVLCSRFWL